jgi:hypothetical protein
MELKPQLISDSYIDIRGTVTMDVIKLTRTNRKGSRARIITKILDHLKRFDINDYYIYKTTGKQIEVDYYQLLEFKYSGYTLFRKSIYDKKHIDIWIEYLEIIPIQYLVKYPPPFHPSKIIIRNTIKNK